jgi:hypothetical protein
MSDVQVECWLLRIGCHAEPLDGCAPTALAPALASLGASERAHASALSAGGVALALDSSPLMPLARTALAALARNKRLAAFDAAFSPLAALLVASSLVLAFAQTHWCGPGVVGTGTGTGGYDGAHDDASADVTAASLECDGELLARSCAADRGALRWLRDALLLLQSAPVSRHCLSAPWWRARALWLQQRALRGAAASLRDAIDAQFALAHARFGLFEHVAAERLISITYRVVRDSDPVGGVGGAARPPPATTTCCSATRSRLRSPQTTTTTTR